MKIKIIACEVMKDELISVLKDNETDMEFLSMGLHLYPEKLNRELQRIIDGAKGYDRIVLAFGLCGGAGKGLGSKDATLTMPRTHDCIPLLLGSREAFLAEREKELGTFYLTCGWLRGEKSILSEHARVKEKYGEKKAKGIIKRVYDAYKRVLFIRTGGSNEPSYLEGSYEVARLLELKHEITDNDFTYIQKIVYGPWDNENFVNVGPGKSVEEEAFFKDAAI